MSFIRLMLFFSFLLVGANLLQGQVEADFTHVTPSDSCGSRVMQFDASVAQGAITSYDWEVRNVSTEQVIGNSQNASFSLNLQQPGTYEATLEVSDGVDTDTKTVEIMVYREPQPDFSIDVNEGCPPLDVTFEDASVPGDGEIAEWHWVYNDGTEEIFTEPTSPTHEYEDNGVFSPTLIVSNTVGCTNSFQASDLLEVYDEIDPSFLVNGRYNCELPHTVSFENTSPETAQFNFTWVFDNGDTLVTNDEIITHEFTTQGIFRPTLIATNATGNCETSVSASNNQRIHLGRPYADFSLPDTVCEGDRIRINTSTDTTELSNRHSWVFGDDGTTSSSSRPYHTFDTPGSHTVQYHNYNNLSGCNSDTMTKDIVVLPSPEADFSVENPNGCQVPHEVNFVNESTDATNFSWNFGDGTTSEVGNNNDVSHTYTGFGTETVRLTASNDAGCSDETLFRYVRINEPSLDAETGLPSGCAPFQVNVTADVTTSEPVELYIFDYGNGNIDTSATNTSSHIFTEAGTSTIEVSIITENGCEASTETDPVTVTEFCDNTGTNGGGGGGGGGGTIGVGRATDCSDPYTMILEDTTEHATLLRWEREGQVFGENQNPVTHTFPDEENQYKYVVSSVLLNDTTQDTITHQVRVIIVDEEAAFSTDRNDICRGLEVNFTTLDIDSSLIASYTWDYGDSTDREVIDNEAYFQSNEAYLNGNTSHVYADTGVFYPTLIIEDIFGCVDSIQYPEPITVQGPRAHFVVDSNHFCADSFNVAFTDSSLANGSVPITNWDWNMDDGTTISANNDSSFSHVYEHSGNYRSYTPTLSITDSLGCTDEYELDIVSYAPEADFSVSDTLRCDIFDVSFTNRSSARVSSYNDYTWHYGDGETSHGYGGSHTYTGQGSYSITLTVEDEGGCVDSITKTDYINIVEPEADFTIGDTTRCVGTFSLEFTSTSTYSHTYTWDFGDGNDRTTNNIQVSHFYEQAGQYDVRLIATGLDGCRDTIIQQVNIRGPIGTLEVEDHYLCLGEPMEIGINGSNISAYYWDFGDFSSPDGLEDESHVDHLYDTPGFYAPSVILVSPEGCQITLSAEEEIIVDSINAGPDANIECGDTHTALEGVSVLGLDTNYFWSGPSGVDYQPDSLSLSTNVNVTGEYVLQARDGLCAMNDTATVTTSGIVPTADAGPDQRIDCIDETVQLTGSTTTPDTRYEWEAPTGTQFAPSDTVLQPAVDTPGEYILTVIQKECETKDTVEVTDCSLDPTDITVDICANVPGIPSTYTNYDLTGLEQQVYGSVPSAVSWYDDEDFQSPIPAPEAAELVNGQSYYARIVSDDGTEVARAEVSQVVYEYVEVGFDSIPNTCESSDTVAIEGVFPEGGAFSGTGTTVDGYFIPPANAGEYAVTYGYTSGDGCTDSLTRNAEVIVVPDPPAVTDTVKYCQQTTTLPQLEATATGDNQLTWYTADTTALPQRPALGRSVTHEGHFVTQQNFLCESDPSRITVIVDTTPVAPPVTPDDTICEGDEHVLHTSGLDGSTFTWYIDTDTGSPVQQSALADSVRFTAGYTATIVEVVETTTEGCTGDTTITHVPVDLHPTPATVSGQPTDTIIYCMTDTQKVMTGNVPDIGTGHWEVAMNRGNAYIDTTDATSAIADFNTMEDTLIADWVTQNGVCPETRATLTLFPEQAYEPEVSLLTHDPVCEETPVTLTAQPENVPGPQPLYYFYNDQGEQLQTDSLSNTLDMVATTDTMIHVQMVSDYHCLFYDTAKASMPLDVVKYSTAGITTTADTLCETEAPVSISSSANDEAVQYEWHNDNNRLYADSTVYSFELSLPEASGQYTLQVHSDVCPTAYDTIEIKIYEQPEADFTTDDLHITYGLNNTVQLPLVIQPLEHDTVSEIQWSPTKYLGYFEQQATFFDDSSMVPENIMLAQADFRENISDTMLVRPHYRAQDGDLTTIYEATVRTGPYMRGCETTTSIIVNNYEAVNIPNAFSPNDDGLNDTWVIRGLEKYPDTKVKVFNRWGNTLFADEMGYNTPWDGTTSNGEQLPFGTYYYVIDFLGSPDDTNYSTSGWLLVTD